MHDKWLRIFNFQTPVFAFSSLFCLGGLFKVLKWSLLFICWCVYARMFVLLAMCKHFAIRSAFWPYQIGPNALSICFYIYLSFGCIDIKSINLFICIFHHIFHCLQTQLKYEQMFIVYRTLDFGFYTFLNTKCKWMRDRGRIFNLICNSIMTYLLSI